MGYMNKYEGFELSRRFPGDPPEYSVERVRRTFGADVPLITADMHLGEGTGAVASIPLWDMALAVYQNCYSFAEGGIEPYTPQC